LGLDYGEKHVGVALAGGKFAESIGELEKKAEGLSEQDGETI